MPALTNDVVQATDRDRACETFVINMPRQTARLAHVRGCMEALGIPVRHIPAVTPDQAEAQAARLGVDLGDRARWTGTERACFMSHITAWQALLDSDCAWGLVLEDDIFVARDSRQAIETIVAEAPPSIVRLETFGRARCIVDRHPTHGAGFGAMGASEGGFSLFSFHGGAVGAAAYMIHRDAAKTFLDQGLRMDEPIDLMLFAHPIPTCVPQAVIWPAVMVQSDRLHESVWPEGRGWEEALGHEQFKSSIDHSPVAPDRTDETIAGRLGKLGRSIWRKVQRRVRRVVPLSASGPIWPAETAPARTQDVGQDPVQAPASEAQPEPETATARASGPRPAAAGASA